MTTARSWAATCALIFGLGFLAGFFVHTPAHAAQVRYVAITDAK